MWFQQRLQYTLSRKQSAICHLLPLPQPFQMTKSFNLLAGALLLIAATVSVHAFAPAVSKAAAVQRSSFRPLASSTSSSSAETSVGSPFDEYSLTDPSQGLEYKDTFVGSGTVAETGKVLTVAYKGRMMSNNQQFDEGESYSFRVGQGRVMPGWEKGVVGMRVGGKRILRIPPSLAFGDRWVKGTIPPNAHVEFDLELKSIAENPIEETWVQLNVGTGRAVAGLILILFLAISPALS